MSDLEKTIHAIKRMAESVEEKADSWDDETKKLKLAQLNLVYQMLMEIHCGDIEL